MHRRRPSMSVKGIIIYRCGKCKKYFPRDGFYKNKRTILGLTSECRQCHTLTAFASLDKEANRKRKVVQEANRRARIAVVNGRVTKSELDALDLLFGHKCLNCGATENLQWDHITPISLGGEHSAESATSANRRVLLISANRNRRNG